MTVKYECDRCHRQFGDERDMTAVVIRSEDGFGLKRESTMHYCCFCDLIFKNGLSIVNNGTYTGSLSAEDKIGKRLGKDLERADPLFNKEI